MGVESKQNIRAALIRSGVELFTEKGFLNAGLDEILRRVNVPKGSFYYYFKSKEAFGLAVLESYTQYFNKKIDHWLNNTEITPIKRIEDFTTDAMAGMERYNYQRGCLVGNLGHEVGFLSERYRHELEQVLQGWQNKIQLCLDQAKEYGELCIDADTQKLAAFFWIGWEGAVLRSRLVKSNKPLELFSQQYIASLPPGKKTAP